MTARRLECCDKTGDTPELGAFMSAVNSATDRAARRGPVKGLVSGARLTRNKRTQTLACSAKAGGEHKRELRLFRAYVGGLRRRHSGVLRPLVERIRDLLAAHCAAVDALAVLSRALIKQARPQPPQALLQLNPTRPLNGPPALPA